MTPYKIKNLVWLTIFLSLVLPAAGSLASDGTPVSGQLTESEKVERLLNSMSLDEKVGQLFIFGFSGTHISESLTRLIVETKPGAIITFKRNIKSPQQVAKLNFEAQKLARSTHGLPLLIMVDQEGDTVTRIKSRPNSPSALAMGMTQDPGLAFQVGRSTGYILSQLGFNLNLAPVADLSDPNEKNFIGNRSFGNDPESVKYMVENFSKGLYEAGVLPVIKHYPGHGGDVKDSHKGLPEKHSSLEALKGRDLVPFRHMSDLKIPAATMVAHIAYPQIDPSGRPATFSNLFVEKILKQEMGFEGLVITDDIEMVGANSIGSIGDRAVEAIKAGCDMIMVAWSRERQKTAISSVIKAVKSGALSEERINSSLRKIVTTKLRLDAPLRAPLSKAHFNSQLRQHLRKLGGLTNRVSEINFRAGIRSHQDLRNSVRSNDSVAVFSADGGFYKEVRRVLKGSRFFALRRGRQQLIKKVLSSPRKLTAIYYVTGAGTARILDRLPDSAKKRLIVVNATHPGLISKPEGYRSVININSRNYMSGRWLAEYLHKSLEPPGLRQPANKGRRLPSSTALSASAR